MPAPSPAGTTAAEGLVRGLTLSQASSVVVGVVIGSGIFIGANRVAQGVDSVFALFAVWIGAGLLTLLGALTYAEFGAMFPRSGGDYVYAQQSLGPFWGFFNGWLALSVNYPASIGALALAFAGQFENLHGDAHRFLIHPDFSVKFAAVAVIAFFTLVNYIGVRQGGLTQEIVTGAKILLIVGLVGFGLFSPKADPGNLAAAGGVATMGLATALVGALWAYDGWTAVSRVAGEVKDPQRNVPRALTFSILAVILIYVLVTLTYLFVLGLDGMRGTGLDDARFIGSRTADALFGDTGRRIIGVIVMVSILGPLNGLTLAGPRVYFAMAHDGLFPRLLARVHPVHKVPHFSIVFQGVVAMLLVLPFTFEQLSGYVILGSWIAYGATGIGLIVLRRRDPGRARPFRVPFFPWIPALFVLLSAAFVAYLIFDAAQRADTLLYLAINLGIIALSAPAYAYFRRGAPGGNAQRDL